MEEQSRVRSMQTMVDGLPLATWVVDDGEKAMIGEDEVEFVDPFTVELKSKAVPTTADVRVKMVAAQELEKAVAGRRGVFLYLFYKRRANTHPMLAIRVETEQKQVSVTGQG